MRLVRLNQINILIEPRAGSRIKNELPDPYAPDPGFSLASDPVNFNPYPELYKCTYSFKYACLNILQSAAAWLSQLIIIIILNGLRSGPAEPYIVG